MYNEVHIHMYVLGVGNASDPIIQVTIANHQLMLIFSVLNSAICFEEYLTRFKCGKVSYKFNSLFTISLYLLGCTK